MEEFRSRVKHVRLGVPRVDAAGRRFTAVYGLRPEEADGVLAFLTDEPLSAGPPGAYLSGGWKTEFSLEGTLADGTPFSIGIDYEARCWRSFELTPGDRVVRPGLIEHLRPFTDPRPITP